MNLVLFLRKKLMLFKVRESLFFIFQEIADRLYPYRTDPAEDFYYLYKNHATGEKYTVMEWIHMMDETVGKLQEKVMVLEYDRGTDLDMKVCKLDAEVVGIKKEFNKIQEELKKNG